MTSKTEVPQGMRPVKAPDGVRETLPVLAREVFADEGIPVIYLGTRRIRTRSGPSLQHLVAPVTDPEQRYAIWSTARLDQLLDGVKSGSRIFIRYEGLQANPDFPGKEHHVWTVATEEGVEISEPARALTELPAVFRAGMTK